jgi:hypothetical protein
MKYANSAAVAGEIGPHGNMILNPGRFTGGHPFPSVSNP